MKNIILCVLLSFFITQPAFSAQIHPGAPNGSVQINNNGAFGPGTSTNIINLFTGCSGTQYLGADGACHAAGGSSVSVTAATSNVVVSPSPGTGTFTVGTTQLINAQGSATSYTIQTSDNTKLVTHNTASAVADTLPVATTTGFGAGFSFSVVNTGTGTVTVTPTTSTINGNASLALTQGQSAYIVSDGTNYTAFLGAGTPFNLTTTGTSGAATYSAGTLNIPQYAGGGSGVNPVLLPSSSYTSDTTGSLFPYVYTGGGANASPSEIGWGVVASLGANVTLQLRFQMPPAIPGTGTFKLVSYCMANATSGAMKYTASDAMVAASASPSAATLTADTQVSQTWAAADVYVVNKTTLSATPTADGVSVVAVTFNATGWTLAAIPVCRFTEVWE